MTTLQMEWIIAGGALLVTIGLLTGVRGESAFQTLIFCFTMVWSAIFAMHFWGRFFKFVQAVSMVPLSDPMAALISFWVGFLIGLMPAVLLQRYWLKRFSTTFPPLFDSLFEGLGILAAGVVLYSLLLMSFSLQASLRDFDSRKIKVKVDLLPIQTYERLVQTVSWEESMTVIQQRLPPPAVQFFHRYDTKPIPPPVPPAAPRRPGR